MSSGNPSRGKIVKQCKQAKAAPQKAEWSSLPTPEEAASLPRAMLESIVEQVAPIVGKKEADLLAESYGLIDGARKTRPPATPALQKSPVPAVETEKPPKPRRKRMSLDAMAQALEVGIAGLSPSEQEAAREAAHRVLDRRRPHEPGVREREDGGLQVDAEFGLAAAHGFRSRDAFGTASLDFANLMVSGLANIALEPGTSKLDPGELNAFVAAVEGVRPENEVEAMLAVQMAATHGTAMRMMFKMSSASNADTAQGFGSLAVKLMRTFTVQTEAMAKLRRKGEQKVIVEHVHVYQGGQAIVGAVSSGGGGAQLENGHHPHATDDMRTLVPAGGAAVRSEDASRKRVPVTGGRGQEAVPDARRRGGKRVAGGKR